MSEQRLIYESKPRMVVDRYYTDAIADIYHHTYGQFVAYRNKKDDGGFHEAKDRRKYGTCPGCMHKFADDEIVYFAQAVYKNGKCLGNLLACEDCYSRFNAPDLSSERLTSKRAS